MTTAVRRHAMLGLLALTLALAAGLPRVSLAAEPNCMADVIGVAVLDLRADSDEARRLGGEVARTIGTRLDSDVLFARIPDDVFPTLMDDKQALPPVQEWVRIRAQLVVTGEIAPL